MVTLTQLKTEQLQARKEKNAVKASLLTTLIGEIQTKITAEPVQKRSAEFEQKTVEGKVKSFLDQNKDAQGQITDELRLAELKIEESILSSYMPRQLSVEEIKAAILEKFPEVNEKNKGPIVGYLKKTFGNSVDGKLAGDIVASLMT
jgi:uncharacterized protein